MRRNEAVFAANFDYLMTRAGKRNSTLAREIGTSRQMVSLWRQGRAAPVREWDAKIAKALNCDVNDLWQTLVEKDKLPSVMIPVTKWAIREGIPLNRARNLFLRGVLDGAVFGEVILIPLDVHAPANSKALVRRAAVNPVVSWFPVNLTALLDAEDWDEDAFAARLGVSATLLRQWLDGRVFPAKERLSSLAKSLQCKVKDLTKPPTDREMALYGQRIGSAKPLSDSRIAA
jgi:transcriptional regulator with XRE-family HTH domain